MPEGTECSTDGAFMPMTETNMNAVAAKLVDDIVLDPDWYVLGGLLGGLSLMVFGVIGAIYYFRKQAWSTLRATKPGFRSKAKKAEVDGTRGAVFRDKGSTSDGPPLEPGAPRMRDHNMDDDLDDLDEDELSRQLQRHHDLVEQEFYGQRELVSQLHDAVTAEADDLKRLLAATLADRAGPNKTKEALQLLKHANTARRLADGALDGGEAEAFRLASQLAVLLEEGADRMARRVVEEVSEAAIVALDARGAGAGNSVDASRDAAAAATWVGRGRDRATTQARRGRGIRHPQTPPPGARGACGGRLSTAGGRRGRGAPPSRQREGSVRAFRGNAREHRAAAACARPPRRPERRGGRV